MGNPQILSGATPSRPAVSNPTLPRVGSLSGGCGAHCQTILRPPPPPPPMAPTSQPSPSLRPCPPPPPPPRAHCRSARPSPPTPLPLSHLSLSAPFPSRDIRPPNTTSAHPQPTGGFCIVYRGQGGDPVLCVCLGWFPLGGPIWSWGML